LKPVHRGRDLWNRASQFVETDTIDLVTELGGWTAEKLWFVGSYLAQTTHAMTGNPSFPGGLIYVDLFCGNGVCIGKETQRRFAGGALLAALCAKPFKQLVLVDDNKANLDVLQRRMAATGAAPQMSVDCADANDAIEWVVTQVPARSLSIVFLDPWSLGVHFQTIETLTRQRRADLLILFPDAMDIDRNINKDYYPKRSDKLDKAMGDDGAWRTIWDRVKGRSAEVRRHAMVEYYLGRLETIGYNFYDAHANARGGTPLYKVVYASKDKLGLKFWRIAVSEDLFGQRSLFG
jgi:three-Cys-motif partner protein